MRSRLCEYRTHPLKRDVSALGKVAGGRDARFIAQGIVPVHLTGNCCDMASIGVPAERYGFAVLEDASTRWVVVIEMRAVGNCRNSAAPC